MFEEDHVLSSWFIGKCDGTCLLPGACKYDFRRLEVFDYRQRFRMRTRN